MIVHKPKWVSKAGCYVVTTVEKTTVVRQGSARETSKQHQYWFSTEQEAINKWEELNNEEI